MKIYPAIDILGGKSVRLKQGRPEDATAYGNPLEMAARWATSGAEWLHVVDLDGAFEGEPRNAGLVRSIVQAFPSLKIQVGGGIRNMAAIEAMVGAGAKRVVLGTAAVKDRALVQESLERFNETVAIAIDARDGIVRVSGWVEASDIRAAELAQRLESVGVRLVIYTDISRDGELEGPNIEATRQLLISTGLKIIASGGVSSLDDIRALRAIDHPRLEGVIIGKALYEGRIQLEEALAHAR